MEKRKRSERTIVTEIEEMLGRLDGWERWICPKQNYAPGSIIDRRFNPMCRANIDPESFMLAFHEKRTGPTEEMPEVPALLTATFMTAVAHLAKATNELAADNERLAWTYVLDAERHMVHIDIGDFVNGMRTLEQKNLEKAHYAKHKETRASKQQIQERYLLEKSSASGGVLNKDDAANLYSKDFPLSVSTIRGYLRNL